MTSVVETAEQLLDQRHLDAGKLASMRARAEELARRFAREERLEVGWERIWSIEPILFDEALVGLADEAIAEIAVLPTDSRPGRFTMRRRSRARASRR